MEMFLIPAAYLLWIMSPFSISEGEVARKTPFFATYPAVSKNGNNPTSQRVHEGGGLRGTALAIGVVQLALIFAPVGLLPMMLLQFAAIPLVFIATRQFIDQAEHGAEAMHGDSVTLDPQAKRWLQKRDFQSYREGEIHRMMVLSPKQYGHLSAAEIEDLFDRRRWLSRIILLMAKW